MAHSCCSETPNGNAMKLVRWRACPKQGCESWRVTKVTRIAVLTLLSMFPCAAQIPVAPCYEIRGRLSNWNGAPTVRIWIIGTHRLLGIHDEDKDLPANVRALLKGNFGDQVYGNFEVCPLTSYQRGAMQMVTVRSASHLVYRHARD